MKLMPVGDYYVWHCDWCDSTNYTIWMQLEADGLACAACHKKFSEFTDSSPEFSRLQVTEVAATAFLCNMQSKFSRAGSPYVQCSR